MSENHTAYDAGREDALSGKQPSDDDLSNPVYMAGFESVEPEQDEGAEPSDARADFEQTSADKVEAEEKLTQAYDAVAGKPVLAQFARIDGLAATHEHVLETVQKAKEFVSEAIREKLHIPLDVTDDETVVLSFGLQLVSFFSEELAPLAVQIGAKIKYADQRLTDAEMEEWHDAMDKAHDRLHLEQMAAQFGLTPEQFLGTVEGDGNGEEDEDEDQPPTLAGSRFHGSDLN